jgi:hypothetical protein
VFERDCLIDLGTCIALSGEGKPDEPCATFEIGLPEGAESGELTAGELRRFPLVEGETAEAVVMPSRRWDAGAGQGQELRATVKGGVAGLILDGRGRPIAVPQDTGERVERVLDWSRSLDLYPEQ